MSTDAQSLMTNGGSCFVCSGTGMTEALILSLLSQVATNGIGGVATQYIVTSSSYSPAAGGFVTITAQLSDAHGNAIATAGLSVTWSKTGSGGSFNHPSTATNAAGIATVQFTPDTTAGKVYTIIATDTNAITGSSTAITVVAGAATQYLVTSSNYAPVAGDPVFVSAQLADAFSNPVSTFGKVVTWSKTGAGGAFTLPTSITNASGIATGTFTTSTTSGVVYVLTGTDTDGFTGSTTNVTSTFGATANYAVTSDNYAPNTGATVNISAQARDTNGNFVTTAGVVVTWSKTGSGGSFGSPTSATNGSGIATVTFTVSTATYTVTGTDTNGKTGTTPNIVGALSALNSDWNTRILAAGGVRPSDSTFAANDVYYAALVSAGITANIWVANTFAPDSLIAAITPLIKGNGANSWANVGPFVAGDLTVNGLVGNGSSKFLNTSVIPTGTQTTGSSHTCVYVSLDTQTISQCEIGTWDGGTGSLRQFSHGTTTTTWSNYNNFLTWNNGAGSFAGYICGSRTTTTRFDGYYANSSNAHASVFNDTVLNPGTVPLSELFVLASKENGTAGFFSNKRISYVSTGPALTTAQSLAHYNAVQQLRTSYGGGFS